MKSLIIFQLLVAAAAVLPLAMFYNMSSGKLLILIHFISIKFILHIILYRA